MESLFEQKEKAPSMKSLTSYLDRKRGGCCPLVYDHIARHSKRVQALEQQVFLARNASYVSLGSTNYVAKNQ